MGVANAHPPGIHKLASALALFAILGAADSALVLLAGCRREPPPRPALVAVSISVVPASGGRAEFEVRRNGTVRGGHLSGDSVPVVHQDGGRVDSVGVGSLLRLAAVTCSQS